MSYPIFFAEQRKLKKGWYYGDLGTVQCNITIR